ncbi:phosphoglycerate mutase-like protein [Nadsonia fulvescens var. elongata DSM 6958]|uniref:Phosphoglycerate mutase-like protein n=1 Tax=Nadsonia fulvescens var. elongata DSM 6958 TaxID=857566 RepID=A0A1E3PR99_9ASCO|nr:phosphoglycerate mutase-like protein [Nadsonia fulvescens var. elongata DSM 6958]
MIGNNPTEMKQISDYLPICEKQTFEQDLPALECQFQEPKPNWFARIKACKLYDMVLLSLSTLSIFYMVFNLVSFVRDSNNSSNTASDAAFSSDLLARDLDVATFGDDGFEPKHHWGSYSEYYTGGSNFPGINSDGLGIPDQCILNQVHALHRHAERYPTTGASKPMVKLAQKLQNYLKNSTSEPLPQFEFLKTWNYTLGEELLTPKGVATEFSAGAEFWTDYSETLFKTDQQFYSPEIYTYENGTQRPIPVIRATTQSRIQTSAEAWAAGFFGQYSGQPYAEKDASKLFRLVLQDETDGNNNTLSSSYACPVKDKSAATSKMDQWINHYLNDTVIRIKNYLPGIELDNHEVYNMQQICAFETASQGYSDFCDFFNQEEWEGYEYVQDLSFYYSNSFGGGNYTNALGAGWASEFVARLEGQLISTPENGVNVTLTNNTETFPVDQPFYLDMTHDSDITYMLTIMDLDFLKQKLPGHYMDPTRQFIASRLVPFGARLYFEVLGCGSDSYIRAKLNGRVLPLESMKDCPKSADGLCSVDDFVSSLKLSIQNADFDKVCYGNN